jgi:hypothetical protein
MEILGKQGGDLIASDETTLSRIALSGPNAVRPILKAQRLEPWNSTVDGNELYSNTQGLIRINLISGAKETLVDVTVPAFALDTCYVYWVQNPVNEVWRQARLR